MPSPRPRPFIRGGRTHSPGAPPLVTAPRTRTGRPGAGPRRAEVWGRRLAFAVLAAAGFAVAGLPAHAQPKGAERLSGAFTNRPSDRPLRSRLPDIVPSDAPIQIRIHPWSGWDRCLTLGNGRVETLIVPAVGRVMQFRVAGGSGPFWDDPALRGHAPDPDSNEWGNFGGDKTWPAPQSDWARLTSRAWPPPVAFDSMPVEASIRRDAIVLTSPIDPQYGIRTERLIALRHDAPVMTITTTYEKVEGDPVRVGVWIITQLNDPVGVFAAVPADTRYPEGYSRQSGDLLPAGLNVERGLLSLTRDAAKSTKIGLDTDRLLWVGAAEMLLIESPRVAGAAYPDNESSAEIYTNPDPKTYVELEMLGPLQTLAVGARLSQTNTYTLLPRQSPHAAVDARRVLLGSP